jgi:hypothetical protein
MAGRIWLITGAASAWLPQWRSGQSIRRKPTGREEIVELAGEQVALRWLVTLVAKAAASGESSPAAEALRAIAADQAALRSIATLAARGAAPGDSAVTVMARRHPDEKDCKIPVLPPTSRR